MDFNITFIQEILANRDLIVLPVLTIYFIPLNILGAWLSRIGFKGLMYSYLISIDLLLLYIWFSSFSDLQENFINYILMILLCPIIAVFLTKFTKNSRYFYFFPLVLTVGTILLLLAK